MRKKIQYYPISQGHIIATWYILFLAHNYEGILVKDAVSIAEKSGKLGGTVPAKQGIKICNDYNLLSFRGERLFVTDICETHILPRCDSEELNIHAQRALLLHILSYHNFEWLFLFDSDPKIFRASLLEIDREWTNLLDNAYLFDFEQEDVNNWWDAVLSKYEDYREKLKKAIGDVGEKLTYHFELKRVETDGFKPPKSFVKWAANFSDKFGYDILSVRGNLLLESFQRKDKIQIEVKSSDTHTLERFRFFVSRPEWNKALENIEAYFFFCWAGVDLESESAKWGPFIIPATALSDYVPTDNSGFLQWSESRCVLDISKYKIY